MYWHGYERHQESDENMDNENRKNKAIVTVRVVALSIQFVELWITDMEFGREISRASYSHSQSTNRILSSAF